MAFTVSQVARMAGVSVRTLHHYDEIGLLHPSDRSRAGYRLYVQADLERFLGCGGVGVRGARAAAHAHHADRSPPLGHRVILPL